MGDINTRNSKRLPEQTHFRNSFRFICKQSPKKNLHSVGYACSGLKMFKLQKNTSHSCSKATRNSVQLLIEMDASDYIAQAGG